MLASFPQRNSASFSNPCWMFSFRNSLFGVLSSSHFEPAQRSISRHERHSHECMTAVAEAGWEGRGALLPAPPAPTLDPPLHDRWRREEDVPMDLGGSMFGFALTGAVTTDGTELDDPRLVDRDVVHLLLVTDQWVTDIDIMDRDQ
ncbi:hypothetical protein HU200_028228 [Digitaria exilis]|uniref:Uncharacterized protein n=1 Tax=Digitaria exilis TaxID=1010633 RepID=A0A835EU15_9POAL|nr:hypothetical protein HU200_028222 [Digitaria exilis]KAF8713449.1 hypothetical protein HU200_028224 [Digitaria exilis]KAF8713453.1 hypothetical protein HU200_028228 [Digitaria exilis]